VELIHIDEFRQLRDRHVVLRNVGGTDLAISKELLKGIASGELSITELEEFEEVARLVFKEYLKILEG
jgi:hypothetical protein